MHSLYILGDLFQNLLPILHNGKRSKFSFSLILQSSILHNHLCVILKKVFDKMRQVYDVVELDQMNDGDQIQSALKEITGIRTVNI